MDYKQLIQSMTIEQKTSLLSGKDFWNTNAIKELKVPSMGLADGPHGLRKQAEKGDHLGLVQGVEATCFPTSATMANSWNIDICEQVGRYLGQEACAHQVNMILGPGLNTKRNPLCGRNFEYFSEDPYLSGKLAAAYVRGIQSKGIAACPKHFVANNQEHLRMTNDSVVDERTLRELYLTGFEIVVKEAKPKGIMSSYNKVNGIYANENKYLLRNILVEEWGFEGMVVSDWGGSNDHVEAVRNGGHLEMPTTGGDSHYQLIQAIQKGEIEESIVDERVNEYLNVLFDVQTKGDHDVDYEAHHEFARKAAEESIVLLKNDEVLPLKKKTKVAIIGDFAKMPRYQGAGSSLVNSYKLESTLDVISEYDLEYIGFAKGYDRIGKEDTALMEEAIALANKAEVILLYIGLNEINEVEGYDREHMKIGDNQIKLLDTLSKLSKPLVGILSCGSAVEMSWSDECDAIIHGYLSGQAGARAILNILTGKINPSGKLSETYPMRYSDVGNRKYYPGKEQTSEYREGLFIGYRYYDTANIKVKYPFGFGLSYTTFQYSDLKVDAKSLTFKLTNGGMYAGSEVAQLYVGKKSSEIYRPLKELKGFKKIFLEPGESKVVTIEFDDKTFRYFDVEHHRFQIEEGEYEIMIGSSSDDIRLKGKLYVEGVTPKRNKKISDKYFRGDITNITDEEFESILGYSVPPSKWDRTKPLERNDSLSQMVYAKSLLARLVIKILLLIKHRSFKKGKPDLNILFLCNMPFRAIAKMTGGAVSMEMVDGMLTIVNGQLFKGVKEVIKSWMALRKREKYVS